VKILNSKSKMLNKFEGSKCEGSKPRAPARDAELAGFEFRISNFKFVSDFGFRISDFPICHSRRLRQLALDRSGSMSIVSLFSVLLLTFLMGMVMNSGQEVDQKVKMQNAADASGYAGALVITRSMNSLAYTNHLLCDVFALTAFLREARDQNAASLTGEILDNWDRVAPAFDGAEFEPFARLAPAIREKVPHEREMVATYSVWNAAAAEIALPVMEEILASEAIPQYQRALVAVTPELAQFAADDMAQRHGQSWPRKVELRACLWRTMVDPVGGMEEDARRSLPAVDPVMDAEFDQEEYIKRARDERESLSHTYLNQWNRYTLVAFDRIGKMSQFGNLWRTFTCGQLTRLLEDEYPDRNLPMQLRDMEGGAVREHLERDYNFVVVVYREPRVNRVPGVFTKPIETDTQAYAQLMLYVPKKRLVWWTPPPRTDQELQGGVPGEDVYFPLPEEGDGGGDDGEELEEIRWQDSRFPAQWSLLSQNWSCQLSPATSGAIPGILSATPYVNDLGDIDTPDLAGLTQEEFWWLSNH